MSARPVRGLRRSTALLVPVVALATTLVVSAPASAAPAPVSGDPVSAPSDVAVSTPRTISPPGAPSAAAKTPARPVAASPASVAAALEARVLRVAASLAGRPYAYGGVGPSSFDCSGYTRYVYRAATGRTLPHNSSEQYALSHKIARSAISPGDLIFFTSAGHIYHVAIYAGHGLIWHAPHTGDHVRLAAIFSSSWVAGRVL